MSILQKIKNFLKRFLPPPARTFLRETDSLRSQIETLSKRLDEEKRENVLAQQQIVQTVQQLQTAQQQIVQAQQQQLQTMQQQIVQTVQQQMQTAQQQIVQAQQQQLQTVQQQLQTVPAAVKELFAEQSAIMSAALSDTMKQSTERIDGLEEKLYRQAVDSGRSASEAVWAETFNNCISGSTWLKNTAFSPGRWAIGYPVLYVLYRVLNESRPKRILELGLGQSTRMIAQYAAANADVEHIVVEHDPEWIRFFTGDFALSPQSRIVQLEREMVPFKEAEAVRTFKGFSEAFEGQRFDLIFIDAPLGGDMPQYARIDVLKLMPDCLSDRFVIMVDDCERSGEAHTLAEMETCLKKNGIPYKRGKYSGKKDCVLLAAQHMGFLATM